jgi:hypothetical protein
MRKKDKKEIDEKQIKMFGFPFQLVQSFSLQLLRTATADTVERADFRGSVGRVEPRTLCDRTCTLQCSSFSWLLAMTKNLCSEQKILFTRNLDEIQQPQILLFLKIPQRNTFPQHLFFSLPCLLPTLREFLPGICRLSSWEHCLDGTSFQSAKQLQ